MLAPIATAAAAAGKHVLIESRAPGGPAELDPLAEAAARAGVLVRVGFNHRFHRALRKAREIFDSGSLGEMMFIPRPLRPRGDASATTRNGALYAGEVGRRRADRSGRSFDRSLPLVPGRLPARAGGSARTYFWDMPVEDNGFLLLERRADRWPFCTRAGRSGRTCSPSRFPGASASWRSADLAAATARSA